MCDMLDAIEDSEAETIERLVREAERFKIENEHLRETITKLEKHTQHQEDK